MSLKKIVLSLSLCLMLAACGDDAADNNAAAEASAAASSAPIGVTTDAAGNIVLLQDGAPVAAAGTATADTDAAPAAPVDRTLRNRTWVAEDIAGKGVIDNAHLTLLIGDDGHLSGDTGCNRMMGQAIVTGKMIAVGPVASTMRACLAEAMAQQEALYTEVLTRVATWDIRDDGLLYMQNAEGLDILRFAAETPAEDKAEAPVTEDATGADSVTSGEMPPAPAPADTPDVPGAAPVIDAAPETGPGTDTGMDAETGGIPAAE